MTFQIDTVRLLPDPPPLTDDEMTAEEDTSCFSCRLESLFGLLHELAADMAEEHVMPHAAIHTEQAASCLELALCALDESRYGL